MKKFLAIFLISIFAFVSCADMNSGNDELAFEIISEMIERAAENAVLETAPRGDVDYSIEHSFKFETQNNGNVYISVSGRGGSSFSWKEGASASVWYEAIFDFDNFSIMTSKNNRRYKGELNGTIRVNFDASASAGTNGFSTKGAFTVKTPLPSSLTITDLQDNSVVSKGLLSVNLKARANVAVNDVCSGGVKLQGYLNAKKFDLNEDLEFDFKKLIN